MHKVEYYAAIKKKGAEPSANRDAHSPAGVPKV